jgi:hypothetical protein
VTNASITVQGSSERDLRVAFDRPRHLEYTAVMAGKKSQQEMVQVGVCLVQPGLVEANTEQMELTLQQATMKDRPHPSGARDLLWTANRRASQQKSSARPIHMQIC